MYLQKINDKKFPMTENAEELYEAEGTCQTCKQ